MKDSTCLDEFETVGLVVTAPLACELSERRDSEAAGVVDIEIYVISDK